MILLNFSTDSLKSKIINRVTGSTAAGKDIGSIPIL